jgi:hypothetical protein
MALALDPQGNILVGGALTSGFDFGNGPLIVPANGGGYIAKLDPNGEVIFARTFAGQIGSLEVASDGVSSVVLAGNGTNVGLTDGQVFLPNGGIFMARLAP